MNYENNKWCWVGGEEYSYIMRCESIIDGLMESNELYFTNGDSFDPSPVPLTYINGFATPAQIEQCLRAYAEKNGYVDQCVVKSVITGGLSKLDYTDSTEYNQDDDEFWFCGAWIYSKGKWAEIVKEPEVKKDLQILCRTDDWGNYQLESLSVIIREKSVTLKELVEVYQQHLDNKTIIG